MEDLLSRPLHPRHLHRHLAHRTGILIRGHSHILHRTRIKTLHNRTIAAVNKETDGVAMVVEEAVGIEVDGRKLVRYSNRKEVLIVFQLCNCGQELFLCTIIRN